MTFTPNQTELLVRARADLRMGVPVVLNAPVSLIIASAETLTDDRLRGLRALSNDCSLTITARRAGTLKARVYDGDLARIVLPKDATLDWIHGIADPAKDLNRPMKGPFKCARGGDVSAHRISLKLLKSARLLPAVVSAPLADPIDFARANNLVCLDAAEIETAFSSRSPLHPVVSARVPLEVSEAGRLHIFNPDDGAEEHYAIEIGKPKRDEPVLARLHSACFTGDLLGSLKCDCGPQLRAALAMMGQEGHGVLLYMNQEGRGIGLSNKMRAYSLQDQGYDTVEANHRLGFEDDERDFRLGADILKTMGFKKARLLTNNPRKVDMMNASGIEVTERVPLHVGENKHNIEYLATKVAKSGHLE
ncbi:MAG: GTP cyclohydrolase II [Roseobacter sp.]